MKEKIKSEVLDELFKKEKNISINRKTLNKFFNTLIKIEKKLQLKKEDDDNNLQHAMQGDNIISKDLDNTVKCLFKDVGWHLSHIEYIEKIYNNYKKGQEKNKPLMHTQKAVDDYKIELAKLFHSLSVKMRMALMFGFGTQEGVISVIDTKKLPTIEQAKMMHKNDMKVALKKATDRAPKIDNESVKLFKPKK